MMWFFLLIPTLAAPEPVWMVRVDFVVINEQRCYDETTDAWGRPRLNVTHRTWVSFWDYCKVPAIRCERCIVARGWWLGGQVQSINQCSDGWILESASGINVITPEIRLVSSDYDWEARNRFIFDPIRKP